MGMRFLLKPWMMSFVIAAVAALLLANRVKSEEPQWIFHHGRIVTVDSDFRIAEAMAVHGDRIVAIGSNDAVLKLAGSDTQLVDLQGKMVLPGLIDSHSHPPGAAVYEFDHEVPTMETIADVLEYIRQRATVVPEGQWIVIQQVFVTRLKDRRFPTRQELDEAAPKHPVMFRTGPDAALNSLALKLSGIDRDFQITDGKPGFIERDPATGEPTGILRSCTRLVNVKTSTRSPNAEERREALRALLRAYNEVGLTSVTDRGTTNATIDLYSQLLDRGELTCRVFLTYYVDAQEPLEKLEAAVKNVTSHPLHQYNPWLWLRGLKFYLDGGMLTGSAYMREPWGVSKIYGINDPEYRGVIFLEPEKLYQIAKLALANGLQPTAHAVGDGAVLALAEAYARVNEEFPVRPLRPCISHANFMSPEAIELMARCGIVADLQPAWLYHDGATLRDHFGIDRLRYFQPYRTLSERRVIVGGGSDHMQKRGRRRSINIYDPWLGIWTVLTRLPRWSDTPLHPEEIVSRQEAIRLYTINNAFLTFEEDKKGSLEPGKYADFIIIDRDILECPIDDVADTQVLETWVGGKKVYP
jgi:predicted amidohydrolase YtcJ